MDDAFFLIGCARSGTTAWARIFETAANARMCIEHRPRLRVASRRLLEGELDDPASVLIEAKDASIRAARDEGLIWGDKNPCYLPFIPHMATLWTCKIVFLVRNGKDVVRSLMDWHAMHSLNFYALAEDEEGGKDCPPESEAWDYSRPRPLPGDPLRARWRTLSRFQKCAWYWSAFNEMGLAHLNQLPDEAWTLVDVSGAGADRVAEVFDFLGLTGFDAGAVEGLLQGRINSVKDRYGKEDRFPRREDWTSDRTREFDELAGPMMARLEYD